MEIKLKIYWEGMIKIGALKTGLKIGVCSSNRMAAQAFMDYMFNPPDKKRINECDGIIYQYNNGDCVRWIRPVQNVRGNKFNYLFCDSTVSKDVKDNILRPMVFPINYSLSNMSCEFDLDKGNIFEMLEW